MKGFALAALREDLGAGGDITSRLLPSLSARIRAGIIARQSGVVCGLEIARAVFSSRSSRCHARAFTQDGQRVRKGQVVIKVTGSARAILSAERVALNFLQRLSG